MALLTDTVYPRLPASPPVVDLLRLYTPTPEERDFAEYVTKDAQARFGFCLLLKTFQYLGYFVPLSNVPVIIVEHIARALDISPLPSRKAYDTSGTRRRHVRLIRRFLQVQSFNRYARHQIVRTIALAADAKEDLADLINVGIVELVRLRYELPGFTVLEKIARRTRRVVHRAYASPATILPDAMKGIQDLYKAIHQGGVPQQTLDLVHLRASQINGCSACVSAGVRSAKEAGVTDERLFAVAAWRETPYFTAAERAALALTEAATRLADRTDAVSDEIWNEAANHFDEKGLAAIILMVATTNLFNRINTTVREPAGKTWS